MGEVRGRTRFQKLLYIFQKQCEKDSIGLSVFRYEPYKYGPFSMELANTIDELVNKGYLHETSEPTESGNTVVIYGLDPKGEEFLEKTKRNQILNSRQLDVLQKVVNEYGGLMLTDLVIVAKSL